jgi:hypoxia up-regulated 1
MEMRLVNYFTNQFNKQLGNGVDIRQSPKAMAKMKKQVKRTKEILSANTAAPISVESLYNDVDFRFFTALSYILWMHNILVRTYGRNM